MTQSDYRISLLHRLAGFVGAGYLHLVGATSAVQKVDAPAYLPIRRERQRVIYALWHNAQVFLAWAHRGEGANIMVSRSKDGEYIAQVMKRLGLVAVRGSSSRGGQTAFRQMLAALEAGQQGGFTPDGPRGPARRVQPGVIAAAQASGAPVVPVAVASRRKLVFRSWDRFFVPLPFSHIVVSHGAPLFFPADEPVEAASERLRVALDTTVALAEAAEREAPLWFTSFIGGALGHIYAWLGAALAPLSLLVFLARHGRKRTFRNLGERLNPGGIRPTQGRRLWLHAASIGEWQALRPVIAELRRRGAFAFIVTVSSPEARAVIAAEEPSLPVRMIPLDLVAIVRRWIGKIRPAAVVIAETELWPNLVACLHEADVPIFIVNGRLSERSARRWLRLRSMAWRMLSTINHFFVRTASDGERYVSIGAPPSRLTVTGNTKVDNLDVLSAAERADCRRRFFGEAPGLILLGGSTWEGEEEALLGLAGNDSGMSIRVVIAPRSKNRFDEVAATLDRSGRPWVRWSGIREKGRWDGNVLLVDTMGELKHLYAACDVAFVGGSLNPRGGQNPLEPAAAGAPVLFGPSMSNFHEEANDLMKAGGARQVTSAEELHEAVRQLARDATLRRRMGEAAGTYVASRQGAARRTADALCAALLVESVRV